MEVYRIKYAAHSRQILVVLLGIVVYRGPGYIFSQRRVRAYPPRILRVEVPSAVVVQPGLLVPLLGGELVRGVEVSAGGGPVDPRLAVRGVLYALVLVALVVSHVLRAAEVVAVVVVRVLRLRARVRLRVALRDAYVNLLGRYPLLAQEYVLAHPSARVQVRLVEPPREHTVEVQRLAPRARLRRALAVRAVQVGGHVLVVARPPQHVALSPLVVAVVVAALRRRVRSAPAPRSRPAVVGRVPSVALAVYPVVHDGVLRFRLLERLVLLAHHVPVVVVFVPPLARPRQTVRVAVRVHIVERVVEVVAERQVLAARLVRHVAQPVPAEGERLAVARRVRGHVGGRARAPRLSARTGELVERVVGVRDVFTSLKCFLLDGNNITGI